MAGISLIVPSGGVEPVRKAVRRLRWFKRAFEDQVDRISRESGVTCKVDHRCLTGVFLEWLRAFEEQKPTEATQRRAYVGFAAGLMMRTLLERQPLSVVSKPQEVDPSNPACFWPEGYVFVAFCLNIRAAVLEQDFQEGQMDVPELGELRAWWSFKENTNEDPRLGMAFLDLFAGEEPNWSMPDMFDGSRERTAISRFHEPKSLPDA